MAALDGLRKRGFIKIRKRRGHINEYYLTGLFLGSGEFATSGKNASGKNASGVVANLPPYKRQYKKQEQSDEQLIELGRNLGLIKNEFEDNADFRSRVIAEMSKRRFNHAMQSK